MFFYIRRIISYEADKWILENYIQTTSWLPEIADFSTVSCQIWELYLRKPRQHVTFSWFVDPPPKKKCKLPSAQPEQDGSVSADSKMKLSIINTSICILALCAHTVCFSWCSVNSGSVGVIISFSVLVFFPKPHRGFTSALWGDGALMADYVMMEDLKHLFGELFPYDEIIRQKQVDRRHLPCNTSKIMLCTAINKSSDI